MDGCAAPNLLHQPKLSAGISGDFRAGGEGIRVVALAQRRHGRLVSLERPPLPRRDVRIGQEGIFVEEAPVLAQEGERGKERTGAGFKKVKVRTFLITRLETFSKSELTCVQGGDGGWLLGWVDFVF